MANNLRVFNLISDYNEAELVKPSVSFVVENGKVYYDDVPSPTFQGKWKATYSDSHTESAQCDSSSAITDGEIDKTNLVSVEIGDDCVTSIGDWAFQYCTGLTSIDIPNSVTSIGNYAFYICSGLTSVEIPNSVTVINGDTFSYCYSLTSCTIGNGVTSIGHSVFDSCRNLRRLNSDVDGVFNIPSGVTKIGNRAFWGCSSLTSINIPSGVTRIGNSTFNGCSSLTSIDIPSGVTYIGSQAFQGCISLTSVTVNATTPPTLGIVALPSCPIYVPSASVNAYKTAEGWSNYASRIYPIS